MFSIWGQRTVVAQERLRIGLRLEGHPSFINLGLRAMLNGSAPQFHESSSQPDRLMRRGGIISGFAVTFSQALRASRAEVIDAVDGSGAVDPLVLVNGNRGTDHAGASTNRIRSAHHSDCEGVNRVFLATTLEQFEALAEAVGAEVTVS